MSTICESEVLNCLPTRHESRFMSDASVVSGEIAESRCGGYLPRSSMPLSLSFSIYLSCLFLFQASRLRHSIRRYTPFRISNFANHLRWPSKEQQAAKLKCKHRYDTTKLSCGNTRGKRGRGKGERAAVAVGRESGESRLLLYTCASRERGAKSAVRGEPNV